MFFSITRITRISCSPVRFRPLRKASVILNVSLFCLGLPLSTNTFMARPPHFFTSSEKILSLSYRPSRNPGISLYALHTARLISESTALISPSV